MMKHRFILILLLSVLFRHFSHAQEFPTGLIMEDPREENMLQLARGLSFSDTTTRVSLKRYCPVPGNQGTMQSCTGWACGYAALSITIAKNKSLPSKDRQLSAFYIYNQINNGDCNTGAKLFDALTVLKLNGDCYSSNFTTTDCASKPDTIQHTEAKQFRIKEFFSLFKASDPPDQKIISTMNCLRAERPVIAGLKLTNSFRKVGTDGIYHPLETEPMIGGHAVCVVGFDAEKKIFEIMNSWGTEWGNKGFFTISFADYGHFADKAFQFVYDDDLEGVSNSHRLSGEFYFRKYVGNDAANHMTFQPVTPTFDGIMYHLKTEDSHKGIYFRISADHVTPNAFIYMLSLKPNNQSEIIFPGPGQLPNGDENYQNVFPLVLDQNMKVEIPENPYNAVTAEMVGRNYLIILFSTEKILDIKDRCQKLSDAGGDLFSKMKAAFGDALMLDNELHYKSERMQVDAQSNHAFIAPIILAANITE